MIKYVDRLMIVSYFKAYFFCLMSLLSLYVVVDLFTNIDDFTQHSHGIKALTRHISTYYGYKIPQIFPAAARQRINLCLRTAGWILRTFCSMPKT